MSEAESPRRPVSTSTRTIRLVRRAVLVLIVIVIAGMLIRYFFFRPEDRKHVDLSMPSSPYALRQFPDLGRTHLQLNETYPGYNSNPPTSGPHAPVPATWGIHSEPVAGEQLVHNMEHGGVIIQYNCAAPPALSGEQCTALAADIARTAQPFIKKEKLVVVAPSSTIDQRIALTAWTFLDAFDTFDQARIESFLDIFIRRFNPEGF